MFRAYLHAHSNPICAPRLMIAEESLTAPNGYSRGQH
jgi:hypothetical protein